MPARKRTTSRKKAAAPGPVVFIHALGTAAPDDAWLETLRAMDLELFGHGEWDGVRRTTHTIEQTGALAQELAKAAPGRSVLLLRAGLTPHRDQIERLDRLLREAATPLALTALSNAEPEYNPFSGLACGPTPSTDAMVEAVALMGRPALHPVLTWPGHLLALSPAAVRQLAEYGGEDAPRPVETGASFFLLENLFVHDRRSGPFTAPRLSPGESPRPPAWGVLSSALQGWLRAGAPDLRVPGKEGRPVTLHVTHSWGGGVSLWTETFIGHDEGGDHLQLRSEQTQAGAGAGQRLCLYLGNELRFPIAEWHLEPPIASVTRAHETYAEAVRAILSRFGVGRVIVSSLIGHSLDALRTGLPTLQVMHDFFPVWPLLSVHPGPYLGKAGVDLDRALAEHRQGSEFGDHGPTAWREIRDAYFADLAAGGIALVAPSQSVVKLFHALDPRAERHEVSVIPHGLPPLDAGSGVTPRNRADGKLRLVIPGRIQPGKGKQWLRESLPRLREHAHVYLLGTGKHGEDFFGCAGVSVVLQYDRAELPGLLRRIGPHLAGLLSIVPETFSFLLSELQLLQVPVIASKRGSLSERIDPGVTGWLIEPDPGALVDAVAGLAADPERLEAAREALAKLEPGDPSEMVEAYDRLVQPAVATPCEPQPVAGLDAAQAGAGAYRAMLDRQALQRKEQALTEVESELGRRSRWAERADAALKRIERRNAQLERELDERADWARRANDEADRARQHVGELEGLVEERTAWAQNLEQELAAERSRRTEWIAKMKQELGRLGEERDAALRQLERSRDEFERVQRELNQAVVERERELRRLEVELERRQRALEATRQRLATSERETEDLRTLQDRILASWSWRATRPLRAARRAGRNAWQARVYNPLRWPLLVSRLVRLLATEGLGGAMRRLQAPPQSSEEAPREARAPEVIAPDANIGQKGAQALDEAERSTSAPLKKPDASPTGGDAVEAKPAAPEQAAKATREEPEPPLQLPKSDRPRVSIVIPAFNQWAYTRRCLESLARWGAMAPFEVIVVDDASSDETESAMKRVRGVTYLRQPENRGFIDSSNRGAEEARGEFLVLLNNDTEVTAGWMDLLLETFMQVPDAGLVGARLAYPDGRLQECGGMIFSDGSGWNYGRHDDPERPDYQYLREVDYCSGACIMLRTETWRELGGFDIRYRPAYYEDTDLAFRIRGLGQRVLVQPGALVIHHEGITSGTDTASGIKRYQEVNRATFLERWSSELERQPGPIEDPHDLRQVRAARDHRLKGRVLVIDATTPEPDQDSGSVRLTNLMRCFQDLGYGVTFFADNRMHAGRYTRQLQRAGVEVHYLPWLDPVRAFFDERGRDFDFVLISRHYIAINYLSLLRRHCPQAPFIFDTVDLHYLREQRLAELENSTALRQVARQTRRSELGVATAADATVVVSPVEVEVLAEDAPTAKTHVISNIHDVHGRRVDFSARKDLFFVGGFQHPPNVDAMQWFVRDIWPLVHERLPEVTFHLIGSKAPAEVEALAGDGVEFHGFVDNLEPYLDGCRLAVAPLRYGAGVKGKVNMSMSYGQPVVATPIAVEGMHAEHDRDVLVAEDAAAFAEQVVRLYGDEALWTRLSDAAVDNVRSHFSLDAARRSIAELLDRLRPGAGA